MEEPSGRNGQGPGLRRFLPNLAGTSRATLAPDLVAGLTVAALAIPQGLAYALVAGCPPETGLFAAAIPATVAALFGSSAFLVTGPTNPLSLVVASAVVAPALAAGVADPLPLVLGTSLVAGVLLLLFALGGIGRASRFLSDSVIAGFATGAGLLIVLGILPKLAGGSAAGPVAESEGFAPAAWPLVVAGARALLAADGHTLLFAGGVPAAVLLVRRFAPRSPGPLAVIALATLVAWALGWTRGEGAVATLGALPAGWPTLALPPLLPPGEVLSPALAIALLATLQSIAAARSVGTPDGTRFDPDREPFGQGAANVATAVLGGIPTCGSLTRSAQARSAGARTRLAPASSGLAMAVLVPLLVPLLAHVPVAALVGLVVLSGVELLDPDALRRAAATRSDAAILVATLGATLVIDLVQALYAGLFLSLALLVRRAGRLQMVEIVRAGDGRFAEIPLDERTGTMPAVLLHLEGDLNFAVAPALADHLDDIARRGPRVVVLRLKRARHLDATVLEALREGVLHLQARGATVALCGLTDDVARALEGTELARLLGPEGLLRTGPRLFEGFERALVRTRQLLAPRRDEEIFRAKEDADGGVVRAGPLDYEI